jgi:dTDP-glucose 4,6-dehydratase
MDTILVTGGAGFIGSNFVRGQIAEGTVRVVNFDELTYAGNLDSLKDVADNPLHVFVRGDIADNNAVQRVIEEYRPTTIVHFAAESHVDRSIEDPGAFVRTNVQGTFCLLDAARRFFDKLAKPMAERGKPGETYNIGGNCERTNLEVVKAVCEIVDRLQPGLS